jgi:hypothetical protein
MAQAVPRQGFLTSRRRGASFLMQGILMIASLVLCAYSLVLLFNDEAPTYPVRTYGALGGAGLLLAGHGLLTLKWRAVIIRYRTKTLAFPLVQQASTVIVGLGLLSYAWFFFLGHPDLLPLIVAELCWFGLWGLIRLLKVGVRFLSRRPNSPLMVSVSAPAAPRAQAHIIRTHRMRTFWFSLAGLVVLGGVATPWLVQTLPAYLPLYTYHGHLDAVQAVAWSPDGKRVASGGGGFDHHDTTVQVWDALTGGHVLIYRGHHGTINALAWSPDGTRIASASADGTVQVWDASGGATLLSYQGHAGPVRSVSWSPDGTRLASGGQDTTIHIWEAATGKTLLVTAGHAGEIIRLAWSPNGRQIASIADYYSTNLQIWDAATGVETHAYHSQHCCLYALAWSPDGKRLGTAGEAGLVQIWDAATLTPRLAYHGHSGHEASFLDSVQSLAWSPDGKRLATGGFDETVQVWDAVSGVTRFTYHGHFDVVNAIAWSPDGTLIASASGDRTVQVWQPR